MVRRRQAAVRTRGRHFPEDYRLNWLLRTFDPEIGPFKIEVFRRNARDLRKWLEGPSAFFDVPPDEGRRRVELPRGWEVIYCYHTACELEAARVTAHFRPPKGEASQEEPCPLAAEPVGDAEGTLVEQNSATDRIEHQTQLSPA